MMDVSIRRAAPDDAAPLADLAARLFIQTYEGRIPARDVEAHVAADFGEARQAAELADPDLATLLVENSGAPAGFAQVRSRGLPIPAASGTGHADVELWRIYLDRSLHGSGSGGRLLAQVGVAARAMGDLGIWLAVWEENRPAISFYRKHGFELAGEQAFRVGREVHRDLVLRAPLDAF